MEMRTRSLPVIALLVFRSCDSCGIVMSSRPWPCRSGVSFCDTFCAMIGEAV
jgi:hypothetical protein